MIRHTLAPMIRCVALILALMLAASSVAWASDVHEEALTGQHVATDHNPDNRTDDGNNKPSKIPAPCDHCCHGNAHHIALGDNASETMPQHPASMRPSLSHQPASWQQTPPTPPPNR